MQSCPWPNRHEDDHARSNSMCCLAHPRASRPSEFVVPAPGLVNARINGVPANLRIDPAAPAMPMITTSLAQRAGLRAGPFEGEYIVGPRKLMGRTAVSRIDLGFGPQRRRIWWAPTAFTPGSEGVIGPGLLPFRSIRFQLRPAQAGERTITLPMVGQGGFEDAWGERYALIDVGGRPLRIRFDPARELTVATASAALRIAQAHSGSMSGAAFSAEIAFGIQRPLRTMQLERSVMIGPLRVSRMAVRTRDHGSADLIREAGEAEDPQEVVVTANRRRHPAAEQVKLGRDQLDRCSSIVFDRPRRKVHLTCR